MIKMRVENPNVKFADTYKNDKDKTIDKKKKLLEKFINVTKIEDVKDSEELINDKIIDKTNDNKEYLKNLKSKDKQIDNLQKELVLKNKELKENKSTISLLKKEIYDLKQMNKFKQKLPVALPIFLDSPLAINALPVYRKYPEYYDRQAQEIVDAGDDFFVFPGLQVTGTPEMSKEINT